MNVPKLVQRALYQTRGLVRMPVVAAVLALTACSALPSLIPGAGAAYAQNTNATIRGEVLDPTGALVPNAKILIVNQDTGVTVFNGVTDSSGDFVAPQVIPGTYRVTVTSPGLKQSVISNLLATVAQVTSINVNLQLGQDTETVTVESRGEQLDQSTSDVSTLIAPSEVQNLPLQQRATENLLTFIPGAAHGGAGDTPNTSQLSINGSRTLNTEVLLNGVSTIVASTGSPATLPSPDGIDSFRVITTNAPAEYGRTSGAVITVNTISGTNTYHGNIYFLLRNEALDANQYFHKDTINSKTGAVTPRNRDRFFQEGGSLGGPIRIPHLYNGHDKTFFFVNYDRTITPASTTLTATVPTAAQRAGDLSNAPQAIYQPNGQSSLPFAGNQIGPIDPAAAKILALLPLPNTVGTFDKVNNRYTGNWTSLQNLTGHVVKFVARVDENLTTKDRLSFNVYRFTTSTPNPISWNNPLLNTTWDCTCNNAWLPSVEYTRTWTPTLVMDLNMGFFRNVVLRNPPGAGQNASQALGIASLPLDQTPELIFGAATSATSTSSTNAISDIGADTNTNQVNITNTYTPFGTLTKTVGPHTFKLGASLRKNEFNSFNPATSPEGQLLFDGTITNQGSPGNPNTQIADFLLGKIKTAQYEQPQPPTGRRNYNFGISLQDDWRVTPKLTLNFGIRYEYESPLIIATNIYSRIDPNTGQLLAAGLNGVSRSLNVTTPKADVSPRIGLAYSIDNKTVIRAAFGTFYGTIFQNLGGQLAYPGFDNTISYNNLGTGIAQPFSLSNGLPLAAPPNLQNPFAALTTSSASNPYSVAVSFNDQSHMPMVQQWNVGFERQLPLALTLEVNYVGNHALHLSYNLNENVVPLSAVDAVTQTNTSVATQKASPYPNLKQFQTNNNIGASNYNGLQVTVRRQFNKQLALLSNYTYAKSEDDGSTIYNFSAPNGTANSQYAVDSPFRIKDFTVSNIDIKHTLNIAVVYTTRGPWWLRDWHISPIFVGHTGLPINITQNNEIPGSSQRPNGDPRHLKLAHPTLNGPALQYYDSAADSNFPLTPSGPVYNTIGGQRVRIVNTGFGDVSRDSNRAPGEIDFDASVAKDFQIYKRLKFQFRIDAFNVINHTNFTAPSGSLSVTANSKVPTAATFATSSGFGQITNTQPNRTMQASTRFFF